MQSPDAVATLKRLKAGHHGQALAQYGLAGLIALFALGLFWSGIAKHF